jgi:hypothetical protein
VEIPLRVQPPTGLLRSLLAGGYLAGSRSAHAHVRAFGRTWGCSLLDLAATLQPPIVYRSKLWGMLTLPQAGASTWSLCTGAAPLSQWRIVPASLRDTLCQVQQCPMGVRKRRNALYNNATALCIQVILGEHTTCQAIEPSQRIHRCMVKQAKIWAADAERVASGDRSHRRLCDLATFSR